MGARNHIASCPHTRQSGRSRYDHGATLLRYAMVCDECGITVRSFGQDRYRPAPQLAVQL